MNDHCADTGIDCREVLRTLELYLDGELPDGDVATLKVHLGMCSPCNERASVEEHVRKLVRSKCAEEAPAELKARLLERLGEWASHA